MNELKIILKPYQDNFLFSQKRFPTIVAGWATGKTMLLLFKAWNYCHNYPNQYIWFIRKEFIDLQDSTMRDFQNYFNTNIPSDRNYICPNNSVISFRHGGEVTLNNLKNANLCAVYIEQAEEFGTDEQFQMLRGRIRNRLAPYNQICMTANTAGHNWIWKMWKNKPPSSEFFLIEANSYENADVIPAETLKDWERMKIEAPNQYNRYVMNSWEEVQGDDYLFTWDLLNQSMQLVMPNKSIRRVMGIDVARFGESETVFTILENKGISLWEQIFIESHRDKDVPWTIGRAIDLRREFKIDLIADDDVGVGGGVTDGLRAGNVNVIDFNGGEKAKDQEQYGNRRAEGYYKLKEMIVNGYLKILNNHELIDQLLTIRYKYTSKGQKIMISKDDLRKEGIKSPDKADALMMAAAGVSRPAIRQEFVPNVAKVY